MLTASFNDMQTLISVQDSINSFVFSAVNQCGPEVSINKDV